MRLLTARSAWLFVAFVLTRTCLALSLLVDREVVAANDVWRYQAVAASLLNGDGARVWEYPLGSLWMTIPPIILGGQEKLDYFLRFVGLALVLDTVTLVMLRRIAPPGSTNGTGAWLWVAAPPVLGLITLTRLDIAACCAAAASLAAAGHGRWKWSSTAAALGAAIKVWPLLIAVVNFLTPRRKSDVALGLVVGIGTLAMTNQVLSTWSLSASFLQYQDRRGLQIESLGALLFLWLNRLGIASYDIDFEFGAQQVSGPGTSVMATFCSAMMLLGLGFMLTYVRFRRLGGLPEMERLVVLLTLCVCVLVVTNKVFSGQYLLWLVLVVAAQAGYRDLHRPVVASLLVACALTHLYFPFMYGGLVSGELLPLTLLTCRDVALIYLMWHLWRVAPGKAPNSRQMGPAPYRVNA